MAAFGYRAYRGDRARRRVRRPSASGIQPRLGGIPRRCLSLDLLPYDWLPRPARRYRHLVAVDRRISGDPRALSRRRRLHHDGGILVLAFCRCGVASAVRRLLRLGQLGAKEGWPCPSDAAIARAYGSHSLRRALVELAWATAPGDPNAEEAEQGSLAV
ncbi:hypothetical protein BQ8794_40167 [Mesorhizobium prunaredense]|uniref:Uncharacterized protein n=1 Tax=Mesorhizobium prunaredense TaxID=1631249 RepID=A0A1R3VCP0_9HYPH|nr:hypothetical protein BQ8794_40167 [Mesorhizobium prunaredense]